MGYKKESLLPVLRHEDQTNKLELPVLERVLWYSCTHHSYLQRTEVFDDSWIMQSDANAYVALCLKASLNVDEVKTFTTKRQFESEVDSFTEGKLNEQLLYVAYTSRDTVLFRCFWNNLRNATAHGGWNIVSGRTYFLGQAKSEQDAEMNFLLQCNVDINSKILKLWNDFQDAISNPTRFKYHCLEQELQLQAVDGVYISAKTGRRVLIDDNFRFTQKQKKTELQKYIESFSNGEAIDIIVQENLNRFSAKNTVSSDGLVHVISQSQILKYFEIQTIKIEEEQ